MQKYILLFAILFFTNRTFSQCCSAGGAIGGSSNVGTVDKKNLRWTAFYRNSLSEDYFRSSKVEVPLGVFLKNAYFNYVGTTIAYGVTNRLTTELELGYFINKTQVYNRPDLDNVSGSGLSNGVVSVKYNLIHNLANNIDYTAGLGVKFPFPINIQDNLKGYSIDVLPSTGTFGGVAHSILSKKFPSINFRILLINRLEYNTVNNFDFNTLSNKDYQFGKTLSSSLFLTKMIVKNLTGIVQLRHEYRTYDKRDSKIEINTGGILYIFSPSISYTVFKTWNFSVAYDMPIYRSYNGKQFANKYSISASVSKQFSLKKKEVKPS